MVHWVKDPALSLPWLGSLLWKEDWIPAQKLAHAMGSAKKKKKKKIVLKKYLIVKKTHTCNLPS